MESIVYYSRNGKKPPFEVNIETDEKLAYINCNCELGMDKKSVGTRLTPSEEIENIVLTRTSDATIKKLRTLFGRHSTLRQHLEEKWRNLRIYADEHPDNKEEISRKRKILGKAFANGFIINDALLNKEPFDADAWEGNREIYIDGINAHVILKYESYDSVDTRKAPHVFYLHHVVHLRIEFTPHPFLYCRCRRDTD